ncbi:MAG: (Fe-S)-binding protein [Deltaproteobacteria bacterium]|nr:(Fe-S)-binding protein [Deltaproteobacteria bacterium]MDQ3296989.1 (Fe-S)-binding protein [Myxococcota bacterium]
MADARDPFSPGSVARQLDYCTFCPKMCRHACPVSTASGRETYIPQVKMDRLNQLRLSHSTWTTETTDPLWACTGCRHCTMYCDHGNEPGLVLFSGRAAAVSRGVPHPALTNYSERFRAREQRLAAQLQSLFPDNLATEGEVGFWPGCDAIDKGTADIAASLALLDRVGLSAVRLVDAPQACAGYPLLAAGHPDLFRWHAGRVAQSLRGFRKVAMGCSACLYAMRAQYPAEGVNLRTEVVSLAELLAPAAQNLACSLQRRSVYYHDPCYHARYNGVIDQPRKALSQLAQVREFAWNKGDTECCGGGGLLPKTMPLVADQMAKRRLAEVQATGGGMVVTSCSTCSFMLKRNAPPNVEVANLATAMAQLSETAFTAPITPPDDEM